MKILRVPVLILLVYRILSSSGALGGWPPEIWIRTSSFSRNIRISSKKSEISRLFQTSSGPGRLKWLARSGLVAILLNRNFSGLSSPSSDRESERKFKKGVESRGLSKIPFQLILGISRIGLLTLEILFSNSIFSKRIVLVAEVRPERKLRKSEIEKERFL